MDTKPQLFVDPHASKRGQALVELCVGLIALIAVVGGLVQLAELGYARMETRVNATEIASERSFRTLESTGIFEPSYISAVNASNDGFTYSADDVKQRGLPGEAYDRLVSAMRPAQVETLVPASEVADMETLYEMMIGMGLVQAQDATLNIPLLPVVRNLIYNERSIDVSSEVWMTRTGDFY